jgi:hypothetical protein
VSETVRFYHKAMTILEPVINRDGEVSELTHLAQAAAIDHCMGRLAAEAKVVELQHEIDLRVEQGKALNDDKDRFKAQVAELEREAEELRCPLTPESHEFEKMRQHYCPYWAKVAEQAQRIETLSKIIDDNGLETIKAVKLQAEQSATIERLTAIINDVDDQVCFMSVELANRVRAALSKQAQPTEAQR